METQPDCRIQWAVEVGNVAGLLGAQGSARLDWKHYGPCQSIFNAFWAKEAKYELETARQIKATLEAGVFQSDREYGFTDVDTRIHLKDLVLATMITHYNDLYEYALVFLGAVIQQVESGTPFNPK